MWIISAVLSAVFAGLTAILAKCGIKKTNSDVATALRTVVVLFFSRIMVFIVYMNISQKKEQEKANGAVVKLLSRRFNVKLNFRA